MTGEEAIEYLKRADTTVGKKIKTRTAEALEMAIKALEQEQYYKGLAESYEKTINKLTKAIAEQDPKTGQRINLKEFEEGISRGCDYAGTQEVVHETFLECIHDIGCEGDWDEMTTIDLNDKEIVLQDLMERFYDKVARNIVNYAKTCEVSE